MGWLMGGFQMARGQHYFSHTLVSMLLAWGISSLIMALFMKEDIIFMIYSPRLEGE